MRVCDAVEHEQQGRAFGAIEQLLKHGIAPNLAGTDVSNHALMHALDPGVHFAALALADSNLRLGSQLEQILHARIITPLRQPNLLDSLRMMAKQRLDGMKAINLF
ncbi:hypothetical protein MT1_1112 [Pseudomonas sp. MT-1]|nr:hypothetical protein MT1_1112 [Pseudomonas sp. MT-1]